MQKQTIILVVSVLALVIGGVFYFTSKPLPPTTQVPAQQKGLPNQLATSTPALKPTSSATPSKPKPAVTAGALQPAIIVGVVLSDSISKSTTSISPISPTTVFSSTAKDIFAVLTLKNATQKTQLSYIRYYEGKYVESNVSHPRKIGTKNFYFQWTLKAGQTRKAGNYSLAFYIDGKKSQVVKYTIR